VCHRCTHVRVSKNRLHRLCVCLEIKQPGVKSTPEIVPSNLLILHDRRDHAPRQVISSVMPGESDTGHTREYRKSRKKLEQASTLVTGDPLFDSKSWIAPRAHWSQTGPMLGYARFMVPLRGVGNVQTMQVLWLRQTRQIHRRDGHSFSWTEKY
jgi:hypothetical protein